jgi:hypothetical protein
MNMPDNIIPLDPHVRVDRPTLSQAKGLVAECYSLTNKYLIPLLKEMLDRADDSLFELADKAENNNEQGLYFDAMREIRRARPLIENIYQQCINKSFDEVFHSQVKAGPSLVIDMDELTLVEHDNLEESMAIQGMVDKIRNRQQWELSALEKRFTHLFESSGVESDDYPLNPRVICDAFQEAISEFDSDIKIRLIIYKLFDRYVVSNVAPLYEAANRLLINAGILPKLSYNVQKGQSQTTGKPHPARASAVQQYPQEDGRAEGEPESDLLSALHELLNAPHGGGVVPIMPGANINPSTAITPVQPQQLISALSVMQHNNAALAGRDELKLHLANNLQGSDSGTVAGFQQRESTLIDVVAMLFDYIMEDSNIPDKAKTLISRLQIPMIKTALLDDEFLAKSGHPARRLLNKLAQSSVGLDQEATPEQNPLLRKISEIVDQVVNDYEKDISIFKELLEGFEVFLEEMEKDDAENEKNLKAALEKREHKELIRARVDESIRVQLAYKKHPKAVTDLITGPWRQVLFDTGMKHGVDSEAWEQRTRLIGDLIASVQPKASPEERRQLMLSIPSLIVSLRSSLVESGFENDQINERLAQLEPLHMALLSRGKQATFESNETANDELTHDNLLSVVNDINTEFAKMDDIEAQLNEPLYSHEPEDESEDDLIIEDIILETPDATTQQAALVDDEYLRQVKSLTVGQWVVFVDAEGEKVRAKLAYISEVLGEFVFTNWRHKVVAKRSMNGLAADLYRGTIEIIEETPILDRALGAVLAKFKQAAAIGTSINESSEELALT